MLADTDCSGTVDRAEFCRSMMQLAEEVRPILFMELHYDTMAYFKRRTATLRPATLGHGSEGDAGGHAATYHDSEHTATRVGISTPATLARSVMISVSEHLLNSGQIRFKSGSASDQALLAEFDRVWDDFRPIWWWGRRTPR